MEDYVLNWEDVLDEKFFKGHPKFSLKREDYGIQGESANTLDADRKDKLRFKDGFIDYALLLRAPKKSKILDAASIGFKLEGQLIDCRQIQGCRKRYRELTPVVWYKGLLNSLKNFGLNYDFSELYVPSVFQIKGVDANNVSNLKKLYDHNAQSLGFRYSDKEKRWVYEF